MVVRLPDRHRWLIPVAIAVLTALAFLPALGNGWVSWDDDKNFLANPDYRGLGIENLRWMWSTFLLGHYIPLSWMTLGLDYVLWGMNPAGYHLTNVLLHSGNAVVLFFVFRRILRLCGFAEGTTGTMTSAVAALLFALHPLRVESVAWITERRDVLSGLFYWAAVLAYLRNGGARTAGLERRGSNDGSANDESSDYVREYGRWYWVSLGFFLAALLSNGKSLTLAGLLLILNAYPLKRLGGAAGWWTPSARRVYLSLAPFVVLGLATVAMTFTALQRMTQLPIGGKIAVTAYSLVFYIWKTVVPTGLSPLYPMPPGVDPVAPRYLIAYAGVAALAIAAWRLRRRHPAVTTALVAFTAIVFPLLGLHQNGPQIAADRYTYHAAPALAILAAAALFTLQPMRRALGISAIIIATLAALTWKQTLVWRNSRTLWAQALRVEDENAVAHSNWGNLLLEQDSVEAAIRHYQKSLSISAGFAQTHNHLGVALSRRGDFDEAIRRFRIAAEMEPAYDEVYSNWGAALAAQGNQEAAIDRYQAALARNPNNSAAHVNWGNALVRMGRNAEAATHYAAALRIRPDDPNAHHNWGVALARDGNFAAAIPRFEAALRLAPNRNDTREMLDAARQLNQRGH